jgi:hypothetical protein
MEQGSNLCSALVWIVRVSILVVRIDESVVHLELDKR